MQATSDGLVFIPAGHRVSSRPLPASRRPRVARRPALPGADRTCAWCCRQRESREGTPLPAFNYGRPDDDGAVQWDGRPFCTAACFGLATGAP